MKNNRETDLGVELHCTIFSKQWPVSPIMFVYLTLHNRDLWWWEYISIATKEVGLQAFSFLSCPHALSPFWHLCFLCVFFVYLTWMALVFIYLFICLSNCICISEWVLHSLSSYFFLWSLALCASLSHSVHSVPTRWINPNVPTKPWALNPHMIGWFM